MYLSIDAVVHLQYGAAMNTREFIAHLGGPTAVARDRGLTKAAVTNWSAGNKIPAKHLLWAIRRAMALMLDYDPEAPEPDQNHKSEVENG